MSVCRSPATVWCAHDDILSHPAWLMAGFSVTLWHILMLAVAQLVPRSSTPPNGQTFTKLLEVKKDRLAAWPSTDLAVYAEQASAFYELMTPYLLSHSFGQGAWEELGTCFRHLHITSEGQGDDTKQARRAGVGLWWVEG